MGSISFAKLMISSIIIVLVMFLAYAAYYTRFLSVINIVVVVFVVVIAVISYISTSTVENIDVKLGPISVEEAEKSVEQYLFRKYGKTINYEERSCSHFDTKVVHMGGKNYSYFGAIIEFKPDKNKPAGDKMRIIWSMDKDELVKSDGILADLVDPFYNFSPMKIAGNYMKEQEDHKFSGTNIIFGNQDKNFSNPKVADKGEGDE